MRVVTAPKLLVNWISPIFLITMRAAKWKGHHAEHWIIFQPFVCQSLSAPLSLYSASFGVSRTWGRTSQQHSFTASQPMQHLSWQFQLHLASASIQFQGGQSFQKKESKFENHTVYKGYSIKTCLLGNKTHSFKPFFQNIWDTGGWGDPQKHNQLEVTLILKISSTFPLNEYKIQLIWAKITSFPTCPIGNKNFER